MQHPTFKPGQHWRVTRPGASLVGMKPKGPGAQRGWSQPLAEGTVLTCDGVKWTFGDGVPVVKWLDADGKWIANDCEFRPATGGMWNSLPDARWLMPWSDDAQNWLICNGALTHRAMFEAMVRATWCDDACAEDVAGLLERAAQFKGDWIVWDPEDNDQGFLLVGDDPFALVKEAVDHHPGIHDLRA